MRLFLFLQIACAWSLMIAAPLLAEDLTSLDAPASAPVQDWLARLSDRDAQARGQAARELMRLSWDLPSLKVLFDQVGQPEFSEHDHGAGPHEVRLRIMQVARHQVYAQEVERAMAERKNPRLAGALGIALEVVRADQLPDLKEDAVQVNHVYHGMSAEAWLQPGDVLLHVDGLENHATTTVIQRWNNALETHKVGSLVKLQVRRHGEDVEITMPMASREALNLLVSQPAHFSKAWDKVCKAWGAEVWN